MCRNFNAFLSPIKIEHLFFERDVSSGRYRPRACEVIQADLQDRITYATDLAEDCSKKSTKAGYDAAGMAIGVIAMAPIFDQLDPYRQSAEGLTAAELAQLTAELRAAALTTVKLARDGGDLLKIWDDLLARVDLQSTDFIVNWETHVRQASQGDMYSQSNAHPHQENLVATQLRLYRLSQAGEIYFETRDRGPAASYFSDTHNGDINDAARYKRFLSYEGFQFASNSDSCVEPALKRFLYEHLAADALVGALHRLAYTDPDYLNNDQACADGSGRVSDYDLGTDFAHKPLLAKQNGRMIAFCHANGRPIRELVQRGFLRDDEQSTAAEKIAELLTLAANLTAAQAQLPTIAAALVARILEYSNPKNKFTFQSFTPLGELPDGLLSGGTYNMVRGGTERGGEEGGELIFYVPKPYDLRNYNRSAFLSASEENALKEQVLLLKPEAVAQGRFEAADRVAREINFLTDLHATAYVTEGVAPIFDVRPGEIVEVAADGRARLFNIYRGNEIFLVGIEAQKQADAYRHLDIRRERLAPLKVFRIEYRDRQQNPIPCPYNKYGEEIIAIQPLALRKNTEKLFVQQPDGRVALRTGATGIGLTMGTEHEELRHHCIRELNQIVTGAAGTSFLVNTIAGNLARKLGLNMLPILNLDGFTGSDTIPPSTSSRTLFIANSNSGGTSDTIKLTHELASLPAAIARIETSLTRRDPNLPITIVDRARLDELHQQVRPDTLRADLPPHLQAYIAQHTPWIYAITNIEASVLGNIGRGLDATIHPAAGAGITNLPEEECVGSTFAAMASLQWQLALHTYIGSVREDISAAYAEQIYAELARLPDVVEQIVSDRRLIAEIEQMCDELVGGNFDFVYTGYLDGVPEEQAHKAAEMIQEMFAGWHFFQFQHGKYAHMKRRTRYTLGSILGHNAPPPSWPFFNARAIKSASEIGPRVATSFFIAHESDRERLQAIPDYAPDFIFTYPADSIVLYPFQVIVVSHLISYFWGLKKKQIAQTIEAWNQPFVETLLKLPAEAAEMPELLRSPVEAHARHVLQAFLDFANRSHAFDRMEGRRREALLNALVLLAGESPQHELTYQAGGSLRSPATELKLEFSRRAAAPADPSVYLSILKDLALELSNTEQARLLANHFLVDEAGATLPEQVEVPRPHGRSRTMYESDYLAEYEGLGTFYDVEPVHPPKIAKAKKGWL
ncbi:MAG: hypothetical protein HC910_19715 [Spirulinaceae cyanobacterium SM2_1_0]|nr:hypothetical protein [Spirulinaceae cyanobacterium SM2_1_0]